MIDKVGKLITKIFGSKSEKDIKSIQPLIEEIKLYSSSLVALSDEELAKVSYYLAAKWDLDVDSDGDGIFDHDDNDNQNYDSENRVYEIDSIYGNRNSEFNLQVHELTYYLNNLDSNDNFESAQIYYSNRDYYEEGFIGETLFQWTNRT